MKYWLMKAEPNSRIEKGKDVKFSVDDFESVKTTAWEGVRNHEAKKLMQSMKVGDQVLFYHSNCQNPGVAGFAEISKEAYPDYTAWDPDHPYYDAKSKKDEPKWFMVDVSFKARATHLVPLHLFKRIASTPTDEPPEEVAYIGEEGVLAIKEMALIKRGRLSVQPVEEDAWKAVQLLTEKGGWKEEDLPASTKDASRSRSKSKSKSSPNKGAKRKSDNMKSDPERDASEGKKGVSKGQSRGRTSTSKPHKAIPAQKRREGDEEGDETGRHVKKRKKEAVDGTEDDSEASALRTSTRRKR